MSKKLLAALLAVCMVASLLFVPAAAATFDDVAEDHWAANAIERWADYDVLNGKDAVAGIFDPSAPMTRAEFASMLVKMLGLTAKSDKTFDDVSADAWYAEVVSIAVKAGIINGKTAGNFAPNDPVTFEEAAVMMCRAFGLAQTTGGADWSKESIDKLTELGMIGEGADEHLQVGVDCNRAVVAALADAVVAEYVNEDKAEPITGEIKGVVLVVKGAKVEIKDATVAAPIVVESAELTLTNTKAEDVKVSGKDAAIAADEASSVANVTLAGEAPKADIKGDVASVTIAEETTGAVIDAPKADADSIVNNSTEDATVNGETVEGKPEETTEPENPDDDKPGSVSGDSNPSKPSTPEDNTEGSSGEVEEDKREPENVPDAPADNDGLTADEGKELCGSGVEGAAASHTWNSEQTNPTCTATGTITYTCETCGATKSETIAVLGHDFSRTGYDASNHYKQCKYCDVKSEETAHTLTYTQAGAKHTAKCTCGYTKSDDHTGAGEYQTDATNHWKACVCGAEVGKEAHKEWTTEGATDGMEKCGVCAYEREVTAPTTPHKDGVADHATNGAWVNTDADKHYKLCGKELTAGGTCQEHVAEAAHSYDQTTDKCECGKLNPSHNHTYAWTQECGQGSDGSHKTVCACGAESTEDCEAVGDTNACKCGATVATELPSGK